MTNINELRRLAQAATPGPWKACRNHECYEGAYFEIDPEDESEYAAKPFTRIEARTGVVAAAHDLFEFDREDAEFIAAANPVTINELLDRIEAAEKDIALKERVIDSLGVILTAVVNERDELRATMEKIADWYGAWGPYPETNKSWCAMAIVTAREAVKPLINLCAKGE